MGFYKKIKNFPWRTCLPYPFPPYLPHRQDSKCSSSYILGKTKQARAELTESLAPFDGIFPLPWPKPSMHQLFPVTVIWFPSSLGTSLPEVTFPSSSLIVLSRIKKMIIRKHCSTLPVQGTVDLSTLCSSSTLVQKGCNNLHFWLSHFILQ